MPLWYLRVVICGYCSVPPQLYPRKGISHLLCVSLLYANVSHPNVRLAVSFDPRLTDSAVPHIADAIGSGVVCQVGTWGRSNARVREKTMLKGQGAQGGHQWTCGSENTLEVAEQRQTGGALVPRGSMCSGHVQGSDCSESLYVELRAQW